MSTYILTWDPSNQAISWNQLDAFIVANRYLLSWFKPYPGTYIVKSDTPMQQIVASLRTFFDGHNFFVGALVPQYTGGAFSAEIWNWINNDVLPQNVSPVTLPGLPR
jgi:hypothetical protein